MSSAVQLDQLRKQHPRWAAAKQQHPAADLERHALDAMGSACARLGEDCFEVGKVADPMHQPSRVSAVFCKAAWNVSTKRRQILAKQWLPPRAVEAVETGLQWIHGDSIADCDVCDILANRGDDAGCLVP